MATLRFDLAPMSWPGWARRWLVVAAGMLGLAVLLYAGSAWLSARENDSLSIPCVPVNDTGHGVQFEFRELGQMPTLIYVPAGRGRHVSMRHCAYVASAQNKPLAVKWRYEDNPQDISYDYTYGAVLHLARPEKPAMLLLRFQPQGAIAARYLGADEVRRRLEAGE